MMRPVLRRIPFFLAGAWFLAPCLSFGQTPAAPAAAEPPKAWTGSIAAGLALTGGNTDTVTTNFAFDFQSDKTRRNVVRVEGLNLRATRNGDAIVDRTSLTARNEYHWTTRSYVFGQFQYLRDQFKAIDYLIAPTVGVGYKLYETAATSLTADGSVGAVIEKNPALASRTSGALAARQKLTHRLTSTTTITQSFAGLWKTKDFDDVLYTFGAGLAAAISTRTQIKVEFLDTYKNKPPSILIEKNDTALVTSFVFKF